MVRPKYMPDPGAQFAIQYNLDALVTELLPPTSPDAAGYITVSFAQQPAAGTLQLQWAVARSVSNTSGGRLTTTNASKNTDVTYSIRSVPEYYEPSATGGAGVNWPRSAN